MECGELLLNHCTIKITPRFLLGIDIANPVANFYICDWIDILALDAVILSEAKDLNIIN